jgi:bacterial/archaeal transporter family protein
MPYWIILGLLSAASAALVAVFGKIGMSKVDPTLATTLRSMVMAGFLVVLATALGLWGKMGKIDERAVFFIVASGLAGAASWLFYFWAIKAGPVVPVAVLDRMSVVFVLILSAVFLSEALTWKTVLAVALMAIAGILVVWK